MSGVYLLASCGCKNGHSVHHTARLGLLDIMCTRYSSWA